MIVIYIRARQVEDYIAQGWRCIHMHGHHGILGRHMAVWE